MFLVALDGHGRVAIAVATGEFQHLLGHLSWEKGGSNRMGLAKVATKSATNAVE